MHKGFRCRNPFHITTVMTQKEVSQNAFPSFLGFFIQVLLLMLTLLIFISVFTIPIPSPNPIHNYTVILVLCCLSVDQAAFQIEGLLLGSY